MKDQDKTHPTWCTPEVREKIAATKRGKSPSKETRDKISATLKRKFLDPEMRAKFEPAWAARRGRKFKLSPEAVAKVTAVHRGVKRSAESRAKMSAAQKRKAPATPEARRNMSEAQKRRHGRMPIKFPKAKRSTHRFPIPPLLHDGHATLIYVLTDPTGESVKIYVGQTKNSKATRLRNHIRDARRGIGGHKNTWVRSLLARGVEPCLTIIAEVEPDGDYQQAEIDFIEHFRARYGRGNVVNGTDGGDGGRGLVRSRESIEKTNAANRGRKHTTDAIERSAAKRRGQKIHPNTLAATRRKRSPEACANIAAAAKARWNVPGYREHQIEIQTRRAHERKSAV